MTPSVGIVSSIAISINYGTDRTGVIYLCINKYNNEMDFTSINVKNYPVQVELASQITYLRKWWGTGVFRTGGIWGFGFGGEICKGVLLNYSYNLCSNVAMNTFGSHQITLGLRIPESRKNSPDEDIIISN